ncbi:MAG: hypothetical protein F6K19_39330, partial [Cyanothece sp. SIO1E1]|nr:hypothetical protein [Cyanothece sp. SIO1E1]
PRWHGLDASVETRTQAQFALWRLSVAHAVQGVLDFVAAAAQPAQQRGVPTGVVFFPNANRSVGQGFDSRLQPWERFSSAMQWHAMAYGICGNTRCITDEVQRVLAFAAAGTEIKPAIAGNWGQAAGNRPALEVQMRAIRQVAPKIKSVSHFAYSWQNPEFDRTRKFCQLR